ncbi:GNAT family N-acetyltransferase [Nocardioides sp.]|jgi:GNAT superfamily N-acetyltransferase|uniref:GNAT family N-acetyltransferase n=1 Tax=Nocardioides sp. TaxID=35761 RepID=UPI002F3EDF83
MSRKVVRMTLDHLAELDAPCRECVFWELDPVRRGRVDEPAAEKEAWMSAVLRDWGSCGRVVLVDDRAVGYALYAPPAYLPGAGAFPTAPVSSDSVLLSAVYVEPDARGGGLGRMLVQGMARDLIERGGIGAVEAFGDTRGPGRPGARSCVNPVDFLTSVGFKTQRAHATTPRMRMDLRTTVTWREELEGALERLLGAVRPAPKTTADHPRTTTRG